MSARLLVRRARYVLGTLFVPLACLTTPAPASGQHAQLSGYVRDTSQAVIAGAVVTATNSATGQQRTARANPEGLYVLVSLSPGRYVLAAEASGFQRETVNVQVEVAQDARLDFMLIVAGVAETVSVNTEPKVLGSRDGSVGTVIDRRFAENIPLSGRTFQSLVELAPGVVRTPGGFAVAGQRTDTNYFQVDGVSAQVSVPSFAFSGTGTGQHAGTVPTGGYNGLSSVDALQEFRVQTSTVAPEYGRGPGAQVSIVTRSGSNTLVGSIFDYMRHDALDSTNWFINNRGLSEPELRQQDFGGVLGGPILRSRLFYFGSYEGLRIRQPRALITNVPSAAVRAAAAPTLQPFINVFPTPTGAPGTGLAAEYAAGVSDRIASDAISVRIDYNRSPALQLFARYNEAPSSKKTPASSYTTLNEPNLRSITTGTTNVMGARVLADVRLNYTSNENPVSYGPGTGSGAPLGANVLPFDTSGTYFGSSFSGGAAFQIGTLAANEVEQINVNGSLSVVLAVHQIKFGADYRQLSSRFGYTPLQIVATFTQLDDVANARASQFRLIQTGATTARYQNVSLFAQDTWRAQPRFSVTYGLRWDVNQSPTFPDGNEPLAVVNANDIVQLDFAPRGTRLWRTRYGNIAPRLGAAYNLDRAGRSVVTGGVGLFYDLGTQSSGAFLGTSVFPVSFTTLKSNTTFPLMPSDVAAPPRPPIQPPYQSSLFYAIDSEILTPYTTQWNLRLERQLARSQSISVGYVGARGERLISTTSYRTPNSRFASGVVRLQDNGAQSRYHSLQTSYRRRVTQGLEAQASYVLARSRDNASDYGFIRPPQSAPADDWGPSSFDIRHVFTGAVSWNLPTSRFAAAVLSGWSVDALIRRRSAAPFTVITGVDTLNIGESSASRPDLVVGVPIWLDDASAPGGRRLNRNAFATPPANRQGTLPRNNIRGFGASQVDFGLRRTITLPARLRLQLGVDVFNLFNQANFADPDPALNSANFGRSTRTFNESSPFEWDLSPLYQWGGPRSVQLGLKLQF